MIRVMIVDDQKIIREGLKKIISIDEELLVSCEAEDGQDAIEKLRTNNIDVILMDVRMPKMDGIEATKKIKKIYPEIKIIILTTFNEDRYIFDGVNNGISGYILKDSNIDYIIMSVKEAYNENMIFDPSVTPKLISAINSKNNKEGILMDKLLKELTERELEILELVVKGETNQGIANKLYISEGTVKNYISKILKKLDLQRRTQLVAIYVK